MGKRNTVAKIGKRVVTFSNHDQEPIDRLLTVDEVADLLRCSKSSLDKWRLIGRGPRFVRVGARVRYRPADVASYVAEQTRASTSGEVPPAA
jgi:excisionase family DNA binding protein